MLKNKHKVEVRYAESLSQVYGRVLTVTCHGYDAEFEKLMRRFALAG